MENLPALPEIFDQLLSLKKIEYHHLQGLSPKLKNDFVELLNTKVNELVGEERDAFIEKALPLFGPEQVWDYNHNKITDAIAAYVRKHNRMPAKAILVEKTGLSRPTIDKHLKSFAHNLNWAGQNNALSIMRQDVMSTVLGAALNGDIRAAKLYLEAEKELKPAEATVKNQNNYVQINETVINQQVLQHLKPEQLEKIREIIAGGEEGTSG